MFRNLNPSALGITGRQSEVIELTLTYKFRGLELAIDDLAKRVKEQGLEQAIQFIASARIRVGGFELPVRWRGDESIFESDLHDLDEIAAVAAKANASACTTNVLAESDHLPYHENFEQARKRLAAIAAVLGKHDIRLAVGFYAAPSRREGRQFQFIQEADALALLLKSVAADNAGLWLDTWNWFVGGGTLETLKAFGVDQVAYVTLADAPSDSDRSSLDEQQRLLPIENGAARVVETVAMLKEEEYKGPVTLAPHPDCFTGMSRDAVLRKCKETLDEVLRAADDANKLAQAGTG